MKRLTGLDSTFLSVETSAMHMHVASTLIYDPSGIPGGLTFERVRDLVAARLDRLPPFRRRLVEIPFQLHHPLWIEDPAFDLDYHLRRACLPHPGGYDELVRFAGDVMGRRLDRSKPLWEMYVVEGLAGGMVGVITKVHHAAVDGVAGAELTVNLLDLTPDPEPLPPPEKEWRPDRIPSDAELVSYALSSLALHPQAIVESVRRTTEAALGIRRRNREEGVVAPPSLFDAPRTSLNATITPHRLVAFTDVDLDEVKLVRRAFGAKVNDVVLALCSGALRHYLSERGEDVTQPLVAMVPISVRSDGESGSGGNRVSGMLTTLASHLEDPVERLAAITDGSKQAKNQDQVLGPDVLAGWAEFAAPAVAMRAVRWVSNLRIADLVRPPFNVTISNVPGPDFPLYFAGAELQRFYPMGPIADAGGLNMTVMSYRGRVYFGLVACRETVPGVDAIARYIPMALAQLVIAARTVNEPVHSGSAQRRAKDKTKAAPRNKPKVAPRNKTKAAPKAKTGGRATSGSKLKTGGQRSVN